MSTVSVTGASPVHEGLADWLSQRSFAGGRNGMERIEGGWTVVDRDAGVLFREYFVNKGRTQANCFAARLSNGQMLVASPAPGLGEADFASLLSF
ncbi:MAG: hypothetical protein H5U40_08980, partial [Polyangiaceae bacterium]|nr:hypothetical protein [Polyangiaceae bacterium]